MKPTVRSTAIAFVVLGLLSLLVGITPLPGLLAFVGGLVAFLAGVGLWLRFRLAWIGGLVYALVDLLVAGLRLWRAIAGGGSPVLPAIWLAVGAFLVVSLLLVRSDFARTADTK